MPLAILERERIDDRWHNRGRERILLNSPLLVMHDRTVRIDQIATEGKPNRGFVTDGGTVPRLGQLWIEKWGRYYPIFLFHDFAWSMRTKMGLTYNESNDMLHDGCLFLTGNGIEAWTIYRCVRSFGKSLWEKGKARADAIDWHYAEILPFLP